MNISIIVAVSENNVIGKDNKLVWRMPADMKYFMDKTKGHCVITGRKNYESIPEKYRPLSERTNIVVTRQKDYSAPGAIVEYSIDVAIKTASKKSDKEIFVIGGADIYKQTIGMTDKIYLTRIHNTFDGDAFFPKLDENIWKEISADHHKADEKNPFDYTYFVFVRKK